MRHATSITTLLLALSLVACRKPATLEIVSFRESASAYGGDKVTFQVKTAPGSRIEYLSQSTYASDTGTASLEFPADKVVAKPGGKGQIFLNLQPPSGAKLKKFSGPFVFDWPAVVKMSDDAISCGSRRCKGRIDKARSRIEMEVEPGTVVVLDGQKLPATGAKIDAPLDLGKQARSAPVSILGSTRSAYKFEIPIVLTFPDQTKLEGKLPRDGASLAFVNTQLGTIEKGPVRFGGEPDGPSAGKSLVVYSILGSKVLGSANTIGDLDLVSATKTTIRTLSCGAYRSRNTGNSIRMDRTLHDEEVSVYERRSGKRVASKSFPSRVPSCPDVMKPSQYLSGYPDAKAVEAWLASLLK